MKILHINDTYAMTGGISRYLFESMDLLEQQGHENIVIYQQEHAHTKQDERITYYIPMTTGRETSSEQTMRDILSAHHPDIVFLHAAYDSAVVAAAVEHIPTVAYIHGFHTVCPGLAKYFRRGDEVCTRPFNLGCVPLTYLRRCSDARHPRTMYRLMRFTTEHKRVYQSVSTLIVASHYMRDLLVQNGFDERKIVILPYPHTPPEQVTEIASSKPLQILYAGRLEIEKGIPYLLQAFANLKTPCNLRIAGDGTLRATYEKMADELNITHQVKFLGWLDDTNLAQEYQAARVIVMPSIFPEPFGQVGVQALLQGRPVVAFNVGGIPDWLKDREHGFLVASRDITGLAERIETLLNDTLLATQMGATGRTYAMQTYAPQQHLAQLLDILEQARRLRT